jgi:uncharacterized protein YciI
MRKIRKGETPCGTSCFPARCLIKERKQLHLTEHRKWLEDQHRAGRVLFSGPTSDRSYGIYVAASLSAAEKLAAQDPITLKASAPWKSWNGTPPRVPLDGHTIADRERMATEVGGVKMN